MTLVIYIPPSLNYILLENISVKRILNMYHIKSKSVFLLYQWTTTDLKNATYEQNNYIHLHLML